MELIVLTLSAAAAFLLVALTVDTRWIALAFGLIFPIWTVGSIPPVLFDAGRIGLAGILAIRMLRATNRGLNPSVQGWALALAAIGLVGAAGSVLSQELASVKLGGAMMLGALLAAPIIRAGDSAVLIHILRGYAWGTSISAAVIILAGVGGPDFNAQANAGLQRLTGLSASAPLVGFQMSLGLAVTLAGWRERWLRFAPLITIVLLGGILLSGGRGGLVACVALILVAALWRSISWLWLPVIGAIGYYLYRVAGNRGIALNTWDRFVSPQSGGDFSSGRLELLGEATRSISENWLFGEGVVAFVTRTGLTPHVAPLFFGVSAGLAGMVVVGAALLALAAKMVRGVFDADLRQGEGVLAGALCIPVLITWSLLEPTGPFGGLEGIFFSLLALCRNQKRVGAPDSRASTRLVSPRKR